MAQILLFLAVVSFMVYLFLGVWWLVGIWSVVAIGFGVLYWIDTRDLKRRVIELTLPKDVFSEQMIGAVIRWVNNEKIWRDLPEYIDDQASFALGVEDAIRQINYAVNGKSVEEIDAAHEAFLEEIDNLDLSIVNEEAGAFFNDMPVAFSGFVTMAKSVNVAAAHLAQAAGLKTDTGKHKRVAQAMQCVIDLLIQHPEDAVLIRAKDLIEQVGMSKSELLTTSAKLRIGFDVSFNEAAV
ncbi:MAG: hypothetical protein WBO07_03120 [Formosimonas sp.]|jgi:hypothetical protein